MTAIAPKWPSRIWLARHGESAGNFAYDAARQRVNEDQAAIALRAARAFGAALRGLDGTLPAGLPPWRRGRTINA